MKTKVTLLISAVMVAWASASYAEDLTIPYRQLTCRIIGTPPAAHSECVFMGKLNGTTHHSMSILRSDTVHIEGDCIGDLYNRNWRVIDVDQSRVLLRSGC